MVCCSWSTSRVAFCALSVLSSVFLKFIRSKIVDDETFPKNVPRYTARRDHYSNQALSRGRIELLGGLTGDFKYRLNKEKGSVGARVHLNDFKKILQCAPHEPDLDGNRGSISMMKLLPPSLGTVKLLCAKIETSCDEILKCQEKVVELSSGKYPKSFRHESWLGLLRIMKDDVYLDWPWGRDRLPGPFESMIILIFHVLDRAYGFPDSVFLMGSEYSNLKWNFPFPAFTNSPSFKSADLPWPWVENFRSELELHQRVMSDAPKSINSSMYHEAFAKQFSWHEKIPKALYRASILDIRQVIFDQALQRPDLIDALWVGGDGLRAWNPESKETGILETRDKWLQYAAEVNITKDSVGYMKQLMKLYSDKTVKSNPSQYKYLVVGTGMTGLVGQYALSGRFVSFLAHSGSVVLLQHSEFSYHFSARLQPWVHYVPLSYSAADLTSKIEWLIAHDEIAQRIAKNARAFGDSYLRFEDTLCFVASALETVGNITGVKDANKPFNATLLPLTRYF